MSAYKTNLQLGTRFVAPVRFTDVDTAAKRDEIERQLLSKQRASIATLLPDDSFPLTKVDTFDKLPMEIQKMLPEELAEIVASGDHCFYYGDHLVVLTGQQIADLVRTAYYAGKSGGSLKSALE